MINKKMICNTYTKKRGSLYPLLVPRNQVFALPFPEDKQRLETHADMRLIEYNTPKVSAPQVARIQ